ncbi:MAG: class I SAM-dependent methyltransferase [Desulfobacteraceae bacterium]|nr:class I SAM-dependent methyltransferase [Desulfobacteraceae bacterium]
MNNHHVSERKSCNSVIDINSINNSDRYCNAEAAINYQSGFRKNHFRDWLEKIAVMRALECIPKKSNVLDFPCGTGRLTTMLLEDGFNLTSADRSMEMLEAAQKNYEQLKPELIVNFPQVKFFQQDLVAGTTFMDMQFDAVVCHRLFHHLVESETRIKAIKELKRITKKFIIFSFFNSHCYSAVVKSVKNHMTHLHPTDRVPVSKQTIINELETQGIKVLKTVSRLWGVSPLCIVIAQI